jgi:hypothetical protein
VAHLGDGFVALPEDARTREQVEWIAEEIAQLGGEASVWLATPASGEQQRKLVADLAAARAEEYAAVIAEASTVAAISSRETSRTAERLRSELHRIGRRDYFPPPERDAAHAAVTALVARAADSSPQAEQSR